MSETVLTNGPQTVDAGTEVEKLREALSKHEAEWHYRYDPATPLTERLSRIVGRYRRETAEHVAKTVAFRDDMLTYFRAMAIVVQSVGSAGSHNEKNARLRGLAEVIEQAVSKIRDVHFEDHGHFWWPDVQDTMRADWPYRRLTDRVRELEAELARVKGEPAAEPDPAEMPF